jgi:hypothetical protein
MSCFVVAAAAVVAAVPAAAAPSAPAGLPALPPHWPRVLQLGLTDGPVGAAALRGRVRLGFRYTYLAGGANTGEGWATRSSNGWSWWLGDVTRAHLHTLVRSGVIALLFGGGADGTTCACDARRDGITNPPPINGNALASRSADDDDGYFRWQAGSYLRRPLRMPR